MQVTLNEPIIAGNKVLSWHVRLEVDGFSIQPVHHRGRLRSAGRQDLRFLRTRRRANLSVSREDRQGRPVVKRLRRTIHSRGLEPCEAQVADPDRARPSIKSL